MTNINTFQGDVGIGTNNPGAPLEVTGPNMDGAATGTSNVISRQSAGNDGVLNTIAVCTGNGEETIGLQTQIDGREYLTDVDAGWNYGNASRYDLLLQPYKGNVGIGTTNPTSMLEVGDGGSASSGAAPGSITVTGTGATKSTGGKPGLYHRALVGLGLWSDAHMTMEVNGSSGTPLEAMRIKSDGKLGIGTTAPLSRLVVTQNFGGSGPGVPMANVVADDGGVQFGIHVGEKVASPFSRTPLRVVDSGETILIVDGHNKRVGIGTNAPNTSSLHVFKASGASVSVESSASGTYGSLEVGGPQGGFLDFKSPFSDDFDARLIYNVGTGPNGQLDITGSNVAIDSYTLFVNSVGNKVGIGTDNPHSQLHIGPKDNDHLFLASSANSYGWKLDTDDQGSGEVPFRIRKRTGGVDTTVLTIKNQNGNVGIGTTNPAVKLQVGANNETAPQYLWIRGNRLNEAGDIGGIHFYNSVNSGDRGNSRIINSRGSDNYASALQFWTNPAGNTPATQKMIIDQNGLVGIGTPGAPSCLLHVYKPDHGLSARIGGYDGVLDIGTLPTTYGAETVYLQTKIDGGTGYVGERQVLALQPDTTSRVGIGSTAPNTKMDVRHNAPQIAQFWHTSASKGGYINIRNQSGTLCLIGADGNQFLTNETNSIGLYNSSTGNISYLTNGARRAYLSSSGVFHAQGFGIYSDERIKDNITDVDDAKSLEIIKQLQPRNYVMRENRDEKKWGFIAQDVEKILPESIIIDQEQLVYIKKKYDITEYNPSVKLSDTVYSNVSVTEHSNLDIDTQQYYIGPDTTNTYYSNIVTEAVYSKSNVSALITDEAFDVGDCVQLSIDETYSLNVCFLNVASVSNNVYVFQDECLMTAGDHDLVDMNLTDSIYLKSKKLKDGKAIDYEFMNPILVSTVQQLIRIVDDLKERVTVLENT